MWLGVATRVSLAVAGNELAHDVERAGKADPASLDEQQQRDRTRFIDAARTTLAAIEVLDVWPDQETDIERLRYRLAPPEKWITLAEHGRVSQQTLNHVAHYCTQGRLGFSGPSKYMHTLAAIDAGDDDYRDNLALSVPQYVGLWRAWTQTDDGAQRLEALLRT